MMKAPLSGFHCPHPQTQLTIHRFGPYSPYRTGIKSTMGDAAGAVQETEQAAKAAAARNIAAADRKLDAQTAKSKHSEDFCALRNGMKKVQLTIARAAKKGVTVKAHGDLQAYHKQLLKQT